MSFSRNSAPRALIALSALLIAALLILPSFAGAHAQLLESTPERGAQLEHSPGQVTVEFNEPVEASFGAVRVYDSEGNQVDDGKLTRPGGTSAAVAIGLPDDLPDGPYTATFRVISADSHPVNGGFVFSIGQADKAALSVSEVLEQSETGAVTKIGFGAVRALLYAAIALALGGMIFGLAIWRRSRLELELIERLDWRFSDAARRLIVGASLALALLSLLGLIFQTAVAAGTGFWAALDPGLIGEMAETRYGVTAIIRILAALLFAGMAIALLRRPFLSRRGVAYAILAPVGLVIAASLGAGGHPGSVTPVWLMLGADTLHVLAMAGWFGGLALLLFLVPRLTRDLEPGDRTRLLAALVGRFSPLALAAVGLVIASGVIQTVVHLEEVSELWRTAFGRAIAIKVLLLLGLVALGAFNRRRVAPRLRQLAADGAGSGGAGRALRNALQAEIALAATVLGVAAVLVSLAPASSAQAMFVDSQTAGPVQVELTFEPLKVGPQELHLYLLDAQTGAQWDQTRDVEMTATEPDRGLGPLTLNLQRVGPGHYIGLGPMIAVPGTWTFEIRIRVSEFDLHTASMEVRIR